MNALLVSHPCETMGVQLRASMPLYERSVGFASLRNYGRSTSGIHARPLSKVRCCRPKKFGRLPEGLPHHYPSLRTNPTNTALSLAMHYILGSLVKGSWIDGKAQTVALLLSACDMPTLFILQTFLPSRRRDCRTTIHRSHPTPPTQKIRH